LMGYTCHWLSPEADGAIPLAKLAAAMQQHQPEILAISHVQWHTGYTLPLAELSQLCRDQGVCLVLDTTQSWGMLEMDLRQTPVDVFISSGYKWPTAGFGSAVMYVSEEIWASGQLPVVGQGSTFLMKAGQKASCQTLPPAGMEAGHRDYASVFALGNGWAELEAIGLKNIENRILELVAYLHQEAKKAGWEIISDYEPAFRSGIVQLQGEESWVPQFAKQKVDISYRQGGIRVSIHFYNRPSDINRLIDAYHSINNQ
jgi:cysteine desulfurase/selenocysteine lyase